MHLRLQRESSGVEPFPQTMQCDLGRVESVLQGELFRCTVGHLHSQVRCNIFHWQFGAMSSCTRDQDKKTIFTPLDHLLLYTSAIGSTYGNEYH